MKKTACSVCALFLVLAFMAGCAAPVATEAPAAAPAATEAPAAAPTEALAAEPAAKEPVTLTYMASQGWITEAELELAKKFEEETGIHVDYQILPADQYFSVLKTKLNSGEATDIFGGQSGKTDLKVQYDVEKNAVDLSGEEWTKRHDPLALEQVSLNGKVYGAEIWDIIASNYFVVNYNKKIFEEQGLSVPKTYAEFKDICLKLKDAGINPIYQPISDGWHHVLWFPMVGPRYEELNPGLAEELNANKVEFAAVPVMVDAMTQLKELYDLGCFGDNALSDAYADVNSKLASGEYAMAVSTLTTPVSIEKDYPDVKADTFGFFPMPLVDNTLAPAHPAGPSKFIYSGSKHIPEAMQYLAFLMEPENLQYLLDNSTEFVTLDFTGLKDKWTPEQKAFLEAYPAKTIVYQDAVNYVNPQWMDIGKDMVSMFTGAMTPEDVLKSIDQRRADMAKAAKDPNWQ
jgi:raffinose/stachyose/melibiose transport system substrate-binding protein